ncbi:maleylpyruvate isomerase N-terminal domain-containing protein [Streptomyces tubercidicus]|uniref:maleylpyruvate isomerase N-terminal domain-containing protein n=1 Tax=Streptomyces tubercidicus TaxID=47759 RepID=UPI0037B351D7
MNNDEILRTHGEALALFGTRVHAVREDQWDGPTPCTEWSVRALVNHLTAEQLWVPRLVRDRASITDIGSEYDGDVLGDAPAGAGTARRWPLWRRSRSAVRWTAPSSCPTAPARPPRTAPR